MRVVARVANAVLREAVADDNGPGAILDVAELAAPSVVEACLARATHQFEAAGIDFVVWGREASRDATLRELYGDLAPVAVIHGENSPTPGEIEVCPGRDHHVHAGDRTMMVGTADELAAQNIRLPRSTGNTVAPAAAAARGRRRPSPAQRVQPGVLPGGDGIAAAAGRFHDVVAVQLPGTARMGWIDALYFTVETMTTTGYGDFSFVHQPTWLRVYAALMMFSGVTTTALLVAFVADVLLSRRFVMAGGRPRVRHLRNHIVVVGLSALGIRVVTDLVAAGYDVAVIERDEENQFLAAVRELDVPVIFGDATRGPDPGSGAGGSRARRGGVDPRRHDQHRNRHRAGRNAGNREDARGLIGPMSRWCCVFMTARWVSRWLSDSVLKTCAPPSSWPHPGSSAPRSACRCWAPSRWGRTPLWSVGCAWRPAANSTGCGCSKCPPKPASSPSPVQRAAQAASAPRLSTARR